MSILGKNALKLGLFLLGLFLAAAVYVGGGLRSYQLYQQAYANYSQGSCGAEFTWSITPQALAATSSSLPQLLTGFYNNLPTLLTVRYRSATPQQITLSVQIPDFSQEQPLSVNATPGWKSQDFHPPILPGMLDTLATVPYRDSQIVLRVRNGAGKECEDSKALRLLSSRAMSWFSPQGQSDADFLAGWVTPQDPAIRELIERATQRLQANPSLYPGTSSMVGYAGTQQDIINQVNVIFDTLEQDYHIRYSNVNIQYGLARVENISLPKDMLQSGIGMCVETTVTMASAIESLHMRPFIYITASHAFLGVAMGPTSTVRGFWETALLGHNNLGRQAHDEGARVYNQAVGQIARVIDITAERQQDNIWPME